ncbi:MAG: thiamine-phosphate kinase [Candidatus Accumulibacter sp.]|jgi:thiamine-monophosphate kinase|nr:thiamine-phosphate kinase [Accumulibacter sp.]
MPSEFDLIARHFVRPTPRTLLGPGDDAALLAPSPGTEIAVTTDALVSGIHFLPETDPERLGWKTLAVNLSDLAAMGATPRWAFLACALPDPDESWLAAFSSGVFACARRYGVDVSGGDTTRGSLTLCVTALGEVPAATALRRDAARAGDDLWVSGFLGCAALGLAHRRGEIRLPAEILDACLDRLEKPHPRVALGVALREAALARAAIDVSDGLLADAGHLAEASKLDVEIDAARLPEGFPQGFSAAPSLMERFQRGRLSGGDDYELLFSAAPERRDAIDALGARIELPLSRIGRFVTGTGGVSLRDARGEALPVFYKGFDHFAENIQ